MSRYRKGSILLEAVAAMAIVVITMIISYKLCVMADKKMIDSENKFNEKQTMNAVCSEVKYNIPFNKLKELLERGNISFKYDEKLLSRLTEDELLSFAKCGDGGDRIIIELESEKDNELSIKIQLLKDDDRLEEEIIKGYWMDYA